MGCPSFNEHSSLKSTFTVLAIDISVLSFIDGIAFGYSTATLSKVKM
jgi:hypothetical protein